MSLPWPPMRSLALLPTLLVALALTPSSALALASHEGWPPMHMLLMNKTDRDRPLDARPGFDPFGGRDRHYRCDSIHGTSSSCAKRFKRKGRGYVIRHRKGHSRLLGGHGN